MRWRDWRIQIFYFISSHIDSLISTQTRTLFLAVLGDGI